MNTPDVKPGGVRACARLAMVFLFFGALLTAQAMSVLPPTFEELVNESARIVRGSVSHVEVVRVPTPDGSHVIKTRVTWKLERVLKGPSVETCELAFLGGTLGGESLSIPGMPEFAEGDEDFLFIEANEGSICPLLAAGHGRYRVKQDAVDGRKRVMRENGMPLSAVSQVDEPLEEATRALAKERAAAALTPKEFEAAIQDVLAGRVAGGSDAK